MNAKEIAEAYGEWNRADSELYEWFLEDVMGLEVEDWPDDLEVSIDPQDWHGISIELNGAEAGMTFSHEQITKVEERGFNVICVHVKDVKHGVGIRWDTDHTKRTAQCCYKTDDALVDAHST